MTTQEIQDKINHLESRRSMLEWYNGKFLGIVLGLENQGIITKELAETLRNAAADIRGFSYSFSNELKDRYDTMLGEARKREEAIKCKK